jgi:hypothetical protein
MRETILLNASDPEEEFCSSIFCWSLDFSFEIIDQLGPHGWKSEENHDKIILYAPSHWAIRITKGTRPFYFHTKLFNPHYHIYFYGTVVCEIHVEIGAYTTHYNIIWCHQVLERILQWKNIENPILSSFFSPDICLSLNEYLIGKERITK